MSTTDDRTNAPIVLSSGFAAVEAFPNERLADLAADILRNDAATALQYSAREGLWPLRERIAAWLRADGVDADAREVIIITGAKQNLDLTARALCAPGDHVVCAEPSYMNGLSIFRRAGVEPVAVSCDDQGIDVAALAEALERSRSGAGPKIGLIYDIPDFHNPTGTVLAPDRRRELASLAARFDVPVLEDNPYRWLRYEGEDATPLKAFDEAGMVVSTGTFAKILGPGLRLGWVHAKRAYLDRIAPMKADSGTSPFLQLLAAHFFDADDALAAHRAHLRRVYQPRRNALLEALREHASDVATWSEPQGGYYVWVRMREEVDLDALAPIVEAKGVKYYKGSVFFPTKPAPKHFMRLSFSYESIERMQQAVRVIAETVREALANPQR